MLNITDFLIENDYDYSLQLLTNNLKKTYEYLGLITTLNYMDVLKVFKNTVTIKSVDLSGEEYDYDKYENYDENYDENYEKPIS